MNLNTIFFFSWWISHGNSFRGCYRRSLIQLFSSWNSRKTHFFDRFAIATLHILNLSDCLKQWFYWKMIVCSCHVTHVFQSESTLYSCLDVKELLARSRCKIWSLSGCHWTRTQNHLVRKWTFNHLAKLAKWLTCVLSPYLYDAFDCMFLSCHIHVLEWIHTL